MKIVFKILKKLVKYLLLVILLVIILIQFAAVQRLLANIVKEKVLADTPASEIKFERLKIGLSGKVSLYNVVIPGDENGNLFEIGKLKVKIKLWLLLKNEVYVSSVLLRNTNGKMVRYTNGETNYNPFFNSFSSDKEPKQKKKGNLKITVRDVDLSEIQFSMLDSISGFFLHTELGEFETDLGESNISKLVIDCEDLLLSKTKVEIETGERLQNEPIKKKLNPVLPVINVSSMNLSGVVFSMNDKVNDMKMLAEVGKINTRPASINIGEESVFVEAISLKDVFYSLIQPEDTLTYNTDINVVAAPGITFSGGWDIMANEILSKNTEVVLAFIEEDSVTGFNPSNMLFSGVNFKIKNARVKHDSINAEVHTLALQDKNGFKIEDLHGNFSLTHNSVVFNKLNIKLPESQMAGSGKLVLPLNNMNGFKDDFDIENLKLEGNILAEDLIYFSNSESVKTHLHPNQILGINIEAEGKDNRIHLRKFHFKQGTEIQASLKGTYSRNKNDSVTLKFYIDSVLVNGSILKKQLPLLQANLPSSVKLTGSISGDLDSLEVNTHLQTNMGNISANGNLTTDSLEHKINLLVDYDNILLGDLISDSSIKYISGYANVSLIHNHKSLNFVKISGNIEQANYNSFELDSILIDFKLENDSLFAKIVSENHLFNINTEFEGYYNHKILDINYFAKITGASSLLVYPATQNEYILTTNANGILTVPDSHRFELTTELKNLELEQAEDSYTLPNITASYGRNGKLHKADLVAHGIDARLETTMNKIQVQQELKKVFVSMFRNLPSSYSDTLETLEIDLGLYDIAPYTELLGNTLLDSIDLDSVRLKYSNNPGNLSLSGSIPKLVYKGVGIKNAALLVELEKDNFSSDFNVSRIYRNNINTGKISFKSAKHSGKLDARITIHDETKPIISIPVSSEIRDSSLYISLLPDSLILGYETWNLVESVQFRHSFKTKQWDINDVLVQSGEKQFILNSSPEKIELKIINAELGNLRGFFNYSDSALITGGSFTGNIISKLEDHSYQLGIYGKATDISLRNELYGELSFNMHPVHKDAFALNAEMKNGPDYIIFEGGFGKSWNEKQKLDFSIEEFLKYDEIIENDVVDIHDGGVSGNLTFEPGEEKVKYSGYLNFRNAGVRIIPLGTELKLKDEHIKIDETGILFNKVEINDRQGNSLIVDGGIFTSDYKSFKYNLHFNTDYFTVFNTTKEVNETIFGKLVLSAKIDLKGQDFSPQLKAISTIHNESDFTFVMPGEELAVNTGEGVVQFQQEKKVVSDSAFLAESISLLSDSVSSILGDSKMELTLFLKDGARYTIFTNPESGDFAHFGLQGLINYYYDKTQSNSVTGNIKIVDGSYTISFYDMIKKEFLIEPNSIIYFSGPINNASVDLTAKDIIRTNSMALMSSESPYMSNEEKALYSQRLPYEVLFKMNGFLLNPEISFGIDLPKTYKLNSPMIAAKLNKLEGDDYENERNMQVFALLVTGGFLAENTGSGESSSSTVAMAAARNSVNGILAQQLNNVTARYINRVDVNLGFNTYEDITRGAGHLTTDLDVQVSKNFMDDRLKLELDSHINLDNSPSSTQKGRSAYNTDFTMLYDLSKNGNYKVKAFNLQIYDLFDGDITNAGFGIMFTKDFDSKMMRQNYVETDSVNVNDN